jgi:hypothetical protein
VGLRLSRCRSTLPAHAADDDTAVRWGALVRPSPRYDVVITTYSILAMDLPRNDDPADAAAAGRAGSPTISSGSGGAGSGADSPVRAGSPGVASQSCGGGGSGESNTAHSPFRVRRTVQIYSIHRRVLRATVGVRKLFLCGSKSRVCMCEPRFVAIRNIAQSGFCMSCSHLREEAAIPIGRSAMKPRCTNETDVCAPLTDVIGCARMLVL